MSRIADKIRAYVNDYSVAKHYGEWGILRPDQRRLIRELCDTCDMFEKTADELVRKQRGNTVAFPCKVGDTVFMIDDYDCEPYVLGVKVGYLKTDKFGEWVGLRYPLGIKYSPQIPVEDIGTKIFLTEQAAEEALAKMKGGAK